jgi:hypothetical protein
MASRLSNQRTRKRVGEKKEKKKENKALVSYKPGFSTKRARTVLREKKKRKKEKKKKEREQNALSRIYILPRCEESLPSSASRPAAERPSGSNEFDLRMVSSPWLRGAGLEAAYRFIVLLLERTTRKREGLGGERCRHKLRALRQEAEDKFGSETEMGRRKPLDEKREREAMNWGKKKSCRLQNV